MDECKICKIHALPANTYLIKPLHHSQRLVKEYGDGSIEISFLVKPNFELERLLLGFGESMEVLQPEKLRNRIAEKLRNAALKYSEL